MKLYNAMVFRRATLSISVCCFAVLLSCNRACEKQDETINQAPKEEPYVQSEKRSLDYYEDRIENEWNRIRTKARVEWDKFTDEELETMKGEFHELREKIQEKYAVTKEEAERMIKEFVDKLN